MEGGESIRSKLMAAAQQVLLEESFSTSEALINTAELVAVEHNLQSPRPLREVETTEPAISEDPNMNKSVRFEKPDAEMKPNQSSAIDNDTHVLLTAMAIDNLPALKPSVEIESTLTQSKSCTKSIQSSNCTNDSQALLANREKALRLREQYKQKRSALLNKQHNSQSLGGVSTIARSSQTLLQNSQHKQVAAPLSSSSSSSNGTPRLAPSKLATMLKKSQDRKGGGSDEITDQAKDCKGGDSTADVTLASSSSIAKTYCFSPAQESLLLAMKSINKKPSSSSISQRADNSRVDASDGPKSARSVMSSSSSSTAQQHRHSISENMRPNTADKHAQPKSARSIRASMERLSKPNRGYTSAETKHDKTLLFGLLDDAKECTFMPKITKLASGPTGDSDAKSTFVDRQESQARTHVADLEFRMGEADYTALVDKKECPKCHGKQSYDEYKQKKKKCQQCNVDYCPRIAWGRISNAFFQKGKNYTTKARDNIASLQRTLEEAEKTVESRKFDTTTGKIITVHEKLSSNKTFDEEEFFERMREKMKQREMKVDALSVQLHTLKCPFKPSISRNASGGNNSDTANHDQNNYEFEFADM